MKISRSAIPLAAVLMLCCPLPGRAEWKEAFVRTVAPQLVNRGLNLLFRKSTAQPPKRKEAPRAVPVTQYQNPQDKMSDQQSQFPVYPEGSVVPAYAGKASGKLPPPPVITANEMGSVPETSKPSASKSKLAVPPPPSQLVPPPPPTPPTGAILGMYPSGQGLAADDRMPAILSSNTSRVPVDKVEEPNAPPVIPRPAPDFRRTPNLKR